MTKQEYLELINKEIEWCKTHVIEWERCEGVCNGQCNCEFVAGLKRAKLVIEKSDNRLSILEESGRTESLSSF